MKKYRTMVILLVMIVLCIFGMGGIVASVRYTNEQEYSVSLGDKSEEVEVTVTQKANWNKENGIPVIQGEEILENELAAGMGQQYEVVVSNLSKYEVSEWTCTIEVSEDCFLNKIWNSPVILTQYHQGNAHTAKEYFMRFDEAETDGEVDGLQYTVYDGERFFPLLAGDCFTYCPTEEYDEFPITSASNSGKRASRNFGLILYHYGDTAPELTNVSVQYRIHKTPWMMPAFWVLSVILALLIAALIFNFGLIVHGISAEKKLAESEKIISQAIQTFSELIDSRDPHTGNHSLRVSDYSMMIAKRMGYNEAEQKRVWRIALLHDCGKIGIPDAILNKTDRLTKEEYEIMKSHTVIGGRALLGFTSIDGMENGAFYHHERWDGDVYPKGLKGEEIPEIARIICVADSFDVMNSKRCYQEAMPKSKILEQLEINKGKQFDPRIADIMLQLIQEGKVVCEKEDM